MVVAILVVSLGVYSSFDVVGVENCLVEETEPLEGWTGETEEMGREGRC